MAIQISIAWLGIRPVWQQWGHIATKHEESGAKACPQQNHFPRGSILNLGGWKCMSLDIFIPCPLLLLTVGQHMLINIQYSQQLKNGI